MSSRYKTYWVTAGVLLLGTGLLILFLNTFELVEEEQRSGYSSEARRNHFLAAQRFLEKIGYEVEHVRGMDKLNPHPDDIILVTYSRELEHKDNHNRLLEWLRLGGHLLLQLQSDRELDGISKRTPFLDALGVKPAHRNVLLDDFIAEEKNIQIFQGENRLTARFMPQHALDLGDSDAEPVLYISDSNGLHIVAYPFGQGAYTVVSEFNLWHNTNIGDLDHAALLAHVLGEQNRERSHKKVWLVMRNIRPSLLSLLWNNAWQFVVSSLTALALGLWYLGNRFGPGLQLDTTRRRSLMEHIEAIGQFEWRMDKARQLLSAVRREVLLDLERRFPELPHKAPEEQAIWLAERLKMPEQDIVSALYSPCDSQTGFTQCIQILQSIKG